MKVDAEPRSSSQQLAAEQCALAGVALAASGNHSFNLKYEGHLQTFVDRPKEREYEVEATGAVG